MNAKENLTPPLILQKNNSFEIRSLSHYATLHDIPYIYVDLPWLDTTPVKKWLFHHNATPVGSVEFVTEAMKAMDIDPPPFNPYPAFLPYGREINTETVLSVIQKYSPDNPRFIKPVLLKQFNGFVFKGTDLSLYDDYDKEQMYQLLNLRLNNELYTSPVVDFLAEWRMYYCNGELLATCRYDPNDEEYDEPVINARFIKDNRLTMAIDIGLLNNGSYVCVECNDAWAIGLYKGFPVEKYYQFLITRWRELCANSI